MSIQLQEIKSLFIKNRLTEGVDFVRKEWLKGNGTAYINTMIPPTSNDVLRAVGIIVSKPTYNIGFISSSDRVYFRFIGSGGAYYKNEGTQFIIENLEISQPESYIAPRLDKVHYAMNNTDFDFSVTFKVNKVPTYTISSSKGLFTQSTLRPDLMATNFPTSTYLIGKSTSSYVGLDTCKLSDVYINSHHFVPCQLLKSIPAILDANNIARAAGECGMYDSISGKFYGNVADSGTFTVEGEVEPETHTGLQQIYQNKLIEGVDYETYDWLKGDGTAYIDTKVTNLSTSDYIKTIFDDSDNVGVKIRTWGREKNRVVVGNNKSTTSITVWGSSTSFVYSNDGVYLYDMYFDLLNNKVIINNQTYNLSLPHGNGASFLLFAIRNGSNAVDYKNLAKYKSFEIHNQINLTPCQLLRSIPRNLDAQCKERQAGECGMIDLISGKFYGNVANSGTFTVENDNNE